MNGSSPARARAGLSGVGDLVDHSDHSDRVDVAAKRVTMFVRNDARFDSRVRREAASLAADGYEVTLMTTPVPAGVAPEGPGLPFAIVPVEARRPWRRTKREWKLLRNRPWGLLARELRGAVSPSRRTLSSRARLLAAAVALLPWVVIRAIRGRIPLGGRNVGAGPGSGIHWLFEWHDIRYGWAAAAAARAPRSDVYHGHDLDGLCAAILAAQHHGGGKIVYDCHDLLLISGGNVGRPEWARSVMARVQARWMQQADAVVTVAPMMGQELIALGAAGPVVVRNCPPRWSPAPGDRDLLRRAAAVPVGAPIVIYHGRLTFNRGIEELLACVDAPGLGDAHFVFLGYGPYWDELEKIAAGNERVHAVPAVPPSELIPLLAGADVGVAVCAPTPNHRVTLPNKLFEWLTAAVPMVVSDFPGWKALVDDDPLGPFGRAVPPDDQGAMASAISDLIVEGRSSSATRERCRRAADERYNWETEVQGLSALYGELTGAGGDAASTAASGAGQ